MIVDGDFRDSYLKDRRKASLDFDLSEEERSALVERDYVALYRLGVPPFFVWTLPIMELRSFMAGADLFMKTVKPKIQGISNRYQDFYKS